MKRIVMLSLCALLALVPPATLSGCSFFEETEPTNVVRDVGAVYLATVNTLNAARASGEIDYETWHNTINPAIQEGRQIYTDLREAALGGDATTTQMLEAALEGVILRLAQHAGDSP